MKNYEKYREPLLERLAKGGFFSLINGHVSNCSATHCGDCEFDKFSGHSGCSDARRAWLNAEASSTLTSDERKLCELLKTGYIAQDGDGDTWHFTHEPRRDNWADWCSNCGETIDVKALFGLIFEGVSDIKTKAWRVEDLLALEVCD